MAAGGGPYPLDALREVRRAADGVPIHMDGARLFNAEVATGDRAATFAHEATTVMCCLSKGLCAPVGSLLAGPAELDDLFRLERKRLGGAMRQAGVLAAAGLVALSSMVERLADDHASGPSGRSRCRTLAQLGPRSSPRRDQHRGRQRPLARAGHRTPSLSRRARG